VLETLSTLTLLSSTMLTEKQLLLIKFLQALLSSGFGVVPVAVY